jgi:hypothetical protein
MMSEFGKLLMITGAILLGVGLLLSLADRIPWLGRLPGDVYIKRDHVTFYFPIATSIVLSIVVSLLVWLFRR